MSFNPRKSDAEGSPQAKGPGSSIKPGSMPNHKGPKKSEESSSSSEMSGSRQYTEAKGKKGKGIPPFMNE